MNREGRHAGRARRTTPASSHPHPDASILNPPCTAPTSSPRSPPAGFISQFIFVNRLTSAADAGRAVNMQVQLRAATTVTETQTIASAAAVTTKMFARGWNPPSLPDASSAVQVINRATWVRYVRLTANTAAYLNVRE